jgi:hypothetical protein
MTDLAFYNAGCADKSGLRKLIVPPRRLIRRVLRPIFQRQVELFRSILGRLDALERRDARLSKDIQALLKKQDVMGHQLQETQALAWDYQRLVPRIADLEDRIEALMAEREREREGDSSVRVIPMPSEPARARAS